MRHAVPHPCFRVRHQYEPLAEFCLPVSRWVMRVRFIELKLVKPQVAYVGEEDGWMGVGGWSEDMLFFMYRRSAHAFLHIPRVIFQMR